MRHHVLTRLAGHLPTVWLSPPREWRRPPAHIFSEHSEPEGFPGLTIYSPGALLPRLYKPAWAARWTQRQRLRQAIRTLHKRGCERIVLYLWRPEFGDAIEEFNWALTCYHIDDEYSFSPFDVPISAEELNVIRCVDHVFIHSPGLLEKKGSINPHTSFVPLGVDYESFSKRLPEPDDLSKVPKPRIGYIGSLKRQLDWPLLDVLTSANPIYSFVFAGPSQIDADVAAAIKALSQKRNVYFLGEKATNLVPAYVQHLDVGLMPYRNDDYAKYGYPLKLHEYLAAGIPAIGVRMRTLQDFSEYVFLPDTPEGWTSAIHQALLPSSNSSSIRAKRQSIAKQHDWTRLVAGIASTIKASIRDYSVR